MTALAPCSTARERATVIPRSLKEPVGFIPSNFTQTWAPVRFESAGAGTRGVPPSPSETTVDSAVTPRRSAYSFMTPRHTCATSISFYSQDRNDPVHDVTVSKALDRLAEILFQCLMGTDHEAGNARRVGGDARERVG